MKKFYSIGLDLGTNSIGWSVISRDFKLVKKGGKVLWGVLLFEKGKGSIKYRLARGARRRYERRKTRIKLLQQIFENMVSAVDENFFRRLGMSYLANENVDKVAGRKYKYNLFNDSLTDKKYYSDYKTVYHLRKYLCDTTEKVDIRLVYLAIHHIVKYRGNFLHDEETISTTGDSIKQQVENFFENFAEILDMDSNLNVEEYVDVLTDGNKRKKDIVTELKKLGGSTGFAEGIANLLVGSGTDVNKFFNLNNEELRKIQFGVNSFEEDMQFNSALMGENFTNLIYSLYVVYMQKTFVSILGEGNDSVSAAMIKRYDKHKNDLRKLKDLLVFDRTLYNKMFSSPRNGTRSTVASYANYVKTNSKRTKYGSKKVKTEDFYKFV